MKAIVLVLLLVLDDRGDEYADLFDPLGDDGSPSFVSMFFT